jgi:hypothetical protein
MSKAYDTSWTHLTKAMKVGHISNYSDEILDHMKSLDKLSKNYPMYKSAWNGYKAVLSVLHDVPKQMMLTQNLKLYKRELARGKNLAKYVNEDFFANEARMIGGDLARQSGNRYMQGAMSIIPYGNVALQSIRYTAQRAKENGVEGALRLATMGTAAAWAYNYVASKPEWADWYFNQIPSDQRMSSLPLPNFIRHARRMWGEDLPVDPAQDFFLIRMPPEMGLFINPILHGMMALGLISTKGAVVPPSLKKDMEGVADQLFGLGAPPLANAAMAVFGKKLEPGKMMHGESPVRDIRDVKFAGANADKMSPQSRIPHVWHDVFNAMFGTVAGTLMEAANYGDIVNNRTHDLGKAVTEGAKKLALERGSRIPYANHVWPDANRRYIYTPYTEKMQQEMNVWRAVDKQWAAEPQLRSIFSNSGDPNSTDRAEYEGGGGGGPVQDPDVRAILTTIHLSLFTGPMKEMQAARAQARKIHESLTTGASAKIDESPLERFKKSQEAAKQVNSFDRQMYNIYQDIMKETATSPSGKAFQRKYGELTPENVLKAVQQSAREGVFRQERGPFPS